MAVTKTSVNELLRLDNNRNNIQNSATITNAVGLVSDRNIANNTTNFTQVGQSISGITSLTGTDNAGEANTTGQALIQSNDFGLRQSATDIQNTVTATIGGELDDSANANIDSASWNVFSQEFWVDSTDLSLLSANINSIGGGVGDTIAGLMRLITALGALADLASNINVGAATGDALENAGNAITEKVDGLTASIEAAGGEFKGLGGINSLKELGNQFDKIGTAMDAVTSNVFKVASAIDDPLGTVLDTVAQDTGIKDKFKEVGKSITDIEKGINKVADGIGDTIETVLDIASPLITAVAVAQALTSSGSKGGSLQNKVEDYNSTLGKSITQITGGAVLSKAEVGTVMDQLNTGQPKDVANAVKTIVSKNKNIHPDMLPIIAEVESYSNTKQLQDNINNLAVLRGVDPAILADFDEIFVATEDNVAIFDTTIQGNLFVSQNDFFNQNKNLKNYGSNYYTDQAPGGIPKFSTCDSYEELAQEVMVTKRSITHLVIHSTNSYNNQFLTAADIHERLTERGYNGMQFHYVIRRDGTLERGIPSNVVSEVTPVDYANYSIDVVMVGGINAAAGTENPDFYKGIESYTRAQFDTLESILINFYRRFPGLNVIGHSDIENGSDDPQFDVKKYVQNRFDR
jgi:N-acetylmuramoyl-L-alanine amidase